MNYGDSKLRYKDSKLSRGTWDREEVRWGTDGEDGVVFRNDKLSSWGTMFIPELLDEIIDRWNAHEELAVRLQEVIDQRDKTRDVLVKANDTCERYDALVEELQGDNDDLSAEADVLSEECDDLDSEVDRLREENAKLEAERVKLINQLAKSMINTDKALVTVGESSALNAKLAQEVQEAWLSSDGYRRNAERLADDLSREKRAHSIHHHPSYGGISSYGKWY